VSRIVVKVGGAVAGDSASQIEALAGEGHECIVVHGAGPQISAELAERGIPVTFVRGRRVTDEAAMGVVREALAEVNAALCAALGSRALGLMGDEIGLRAAQVHELGLVGDPVPTCPPAVLEALDAGLVPVVAPLAEGPLNVNADEAAAALAIGIGAERLIFLTDVPGVLRGDGVLAEIDAGEADRLLGDGTFAGGIVPKLEAAVHAARSGVRARIGATEVVA
jgi:acetylglutamate kinase